jgi:hypothetical protein
VEDALGVVVSASGATGPAGPQGSAVLDLVENHDFAAPATSYTFAGLDGDTDEVYLLTYRIIKAVGAATNVVVQPNALTTNQLTKIVFGGSSSGSDSYTDLRIIASGSLTTGDVAEGRFWFAAKTGAIRTGRAAWADTDGVNLYLHDTAEHWTDTVVNITSLKVLSSQANGIGTGSYLRLYKLRKAPAAGNFVEVTVALDGNLIFTATVTGQTWVTATSKIICAVFAVATSGTTEEMAMVSGVTVGAKNRVAGVGFDVWVYNPQGMTGTLTIHAFGG